MPDPSTHEDLRLIPKLDKCLGASMLGEHGGCACLYTEIDRLSARLATLEAVAEAAQEYDRDGNRQSFRVLRGALRRLDAQDETTLTGENFAAQVQEARRLLDEGDESGLIAYLLGVKVADVIRVGSQDETTHRGGS